MRLHPDNAARYQPGRKTGHVESWFWRANHPTEPKAFWLKATILAGPSTPTVADAWCCTFDGGTSTVWGGRQTVPVERTDFGTSIQVAGCNFLLDPAGGTANGGLGKTTWDLRYSPVPGPLSAPLCLLPSRRMVDGPFPRSKLLTPAPVLRFSGEMNWDGRRVVVDDWLGMQGHNWGREHAHTYAWGQCLFTDGRGEPLAMVEGFSGRIRLGGLLTPLLSAMVVRHGERSYRFDRIVDLWNQSPRIESDRWILGMRGPAGEAQLSMCFKPDEVACLGYANPDGHTSTCLNSKLARTVLRVNPVNEDPFECRSEHGGALEFLRRQPDPRFEVVA